MHGTVGEVIYETLKAHGVTHLFGMEDPVHIFHALDPAVVRPITVRDEKHGAVMAHGYAKATGRPGVCASMFGPGATNLVTGLLEARQSSIPIIAFVLDTAAKHRGRHAASELDHVEALSPFVKWVGRIELPERAAEISRHAFRIATSGRPGPVVVLCARDVMATRVETEVFAEPGYDRFPATRIRPSRERLAEAADLLLAAKRPVIVAGGGALASGAWGSVVALAERYRIPVATTMNGRGVIADSHPLSVGVLGSSTGAKYGRGQVANRVLAEADLAFIMGSRTGQICTSDWTLPAAGTAVIHLDIDPMEIGRNFRTQVALVGDVRETLADLLELCGERPAPARRPDPVPAIERLKAAWRAEIDPLFRSVQVPIRPERLLKAISDRMDARTTLVTDASYVTGWAFSHVDTPGGGQGIISPRGTGGLGWGLPAAIGAKLARPERGVICVTGDGGFGYVLGELETAARYDVPVVVVVFNNGTLAFQRHFEEKLFGTARECDLLPVDYSAVARDLGCLGERVTQPADIEPALDRALAAGRPYLIDVVIDPSAMAPIVGLESDAAMDSH